MQRALKKEKIPRVNKQQHSCCHRKPQFNCWGLPSAFSTMLQCTNTTNGTTVKKNVNVSHRILWYIHLTTVASKAFPGVVQLIVFLHSCIAVAESFAAKWVVAFVHYRKSGLDTIKPEKTVKLRNSVPRADRKNLKSYSISYFQLLQMWQK